MRTAALVACALLFGGSAPDLFQHRGPGEPVPSRDPSGGQTIVINPDETYDEYLMRVGDPRMERLGTASSRLWKWAHPDWYVVDWRASHFWRRNPVTLRISVQVQ